MSTTTFKRMRLAEFRSLYFTGEQAPCNTTLVNHIKSGRLSGEQIGGGWYVHVHPWGQPVYYGEPRTTPQQLPETTGNKLADRILKLAAA